MENSDHADPASAQKPADHTETAPAQTVADAERIAKLEKTVNGLANVIRQLQPHKTESKPAKTADDEIKTRVEAIEARNTALNERAAKISIESAFGDYGISGEYKRDAVRDFKEEHGDKLQYTAAGEVLVKASEIDEPVPVADFIKRLVSEKKYDRFRPAVQTPKTGPDGKPIAAKRQMTLAQYRDAHARREKVNLADIELID